MMKSGEPGGQSEMHLSKTPSIQSLLDSDIESVSSYQYGEFEELDEVEYALPASDAPSLEEILNCKQLDISEDGIENKHNEPATCSGLHIEVLQAVSQQVAQAEERSSAGPATTLSVGTNGRLTVGTAHGHILSFHDQTLRWVSDKYTDLGAIASLAYNQDGSRLLAGFARGPVYQYESKHGDVLRKITFSGDIWGTLKVTWAGTGGILLDTGGSVWLMRFTRPLGVRSTKVSCIFSGSRGEVLALAAKDARILALATHTRIIVVCGGQAAGVKLMGPTHMMPVLEWFDSKSDILVYARGHFLIWLKLSFTGTTISLQPLKRVELKTVPMFLGWLSPLSAIIFDSTESISIMDDQFDEPLDLSHIQPVYASAFYKGHWTEGRVSLAMSRAGETALAGACIVDGILTILGRKGIVRVRLRDVITRSKMFMSSGHYLEALKLLSSTRGTESVMVAREFVATFIEKPHILCNKNVANEAVKICIKLGLSDELWSQLWENCSQQTALVEALGDAAVRGDFVDDPPTPDYTQALIERLADVEPDLVERVLASLPLTSINVHRASIFTRQRKLWRGVGALVAALDGCSGAMRELTGYVDAACGVRRGESCACAGAALVLCAADALAGRSPVARPLPAHALPSARHDALQALLHENQGKSPLRVMVEHDVSSAMRLLEQCSREPPFAGPLGKQNRLRVARALLTFTTTSGDPQDQERTLEIIEFLGGQLQNGALPLDQQLIQNIQDLVASIENEKSDRAWIGILMRMRNQRDQLFADYRNHIERPRILWKVDSLIDRHDEAIKQFFDIESPSQQDIDEFFVYIQSIISSSDIRKRLHDFLPKIIELRPGAVAALLTDEQSSGAVADTMRVLRDERALQFGKCLLDMGRLRGEAATVYLRHLCVSEPADVRHFLTKHSGLVRPEDALALVTELGPKDAEPICLEATGDYKGALDALLNMITEDDQERVAMEACELCVRVCGTVPRADGQEMWTRLLRHLPAVPPALVFEAFAYLPLEELLSKTVNSVQTVAGEEDIG
ncbi:vacuolar protein sorting-associated protein 8 homolog isoform X2 [Leptidea sinapis]|uniref:vacuolar protein sorting-associated protein 8 homolog isoform X2 n=1 Tax=Leptidea sinapis TaxID=189913 RepID=UPI002139D8D0|nr:vacuolar protein sorting-associated protein 8 homolog isoform X2 [Leptidea sinapis]